MTNGLVRLTSNEDTDLGTAREESIRRLVEKFPALDTPRRPLATRHDEEWGARTYAFSSM